MIAANLLSCFAALFHGEAKENLLLLRVINSLMSWCIATKLIKYQRLFNCPVVHTDSDRWKRNPRNDLNDIEACRAVQLNCSWKLRSHLGIGSPRQLRTASNCNFIACRRWLSVQLSVIASLCVTIMPAQTSARLFPAEQARFRDRLPQRSLRTHLDGGRRRKSPVSLGLPRDALKEKELSLRFFICAQSPEQLRTQWSLPCKVDQGLKWTWSLLW